ncbi:MAG: DUF2997 domain-containing protein [Pseudanabaena sp. ELA645]|jgi:hypothetical protein
MSQYQRIEYLIGKDGKVVERAIDVSGIECIALTSAIESNLGQVESRELLPSYHMTFEQSAVEQNNIDSYRDVS